MNGEERYISRKAALTGLLSDICDDLFSQTPIQRLYEDNLEGKISDERFARMTANYEEEQKGLESRVAELKKLLAAETDRSVNVDHFLALVRKYTDVKELTAEILREFVEKVYVYQAERIDGQKVQRIRIVWNCIGEFTPPTLTNTEKSA